jgi:hypothetical protein
MDNLLDEGKKPLSEKQLYELVANNSLHLEAIDFDAKIHYLSNGHLNATSLQGEQDKGRWSVTSDNQLCMKFELWYFGDLKCYNLIEDNDKYLYFTTNGARYYTGTKTFGDDSGLENTGPTGTINHAAPKPKAPQATRLSTAEKKRALVSLARNCPDCNFSGVDLRGAQLIGANLAGANLSGADLRDANLRRANLTGANLTEANLARINLAGADLTDCNLSDADLSGSNLIRANVTGAILTGAILSGAHLESIQGFKE